MLRHCVIDVSDGIEGVRAVLVEQCDNIDDLRPLGQKWIGELSAEEYGLHTDIDTVIDDLKACSVNESVILVGKDNDEIIALFAVFAVPSFLGDQKIAVEKYWYAQRDHHTAGPKLYTEAVKWAREHGCSHLLTSGSKMASDRHDSICRFLEATGAQHFETSYIYNLGEQA
jgi:hypothetical protein